MATFYYDPMLDVHHRLPVYANTVTSMYAAPQEPDDARRLFDAACAGLGVLGDGPVDPLPGPRSAAAILALARHWALDDLADRMATAIDEQLEPTRDRARGEFTWGLGLGEEHPRGQYNAYLAAAEAMTPGAWDRLSAARLPECPQVVDVDFPRVAMRRAAWTDGALDLSVVVLDPTPDRTTTFRIVGAGGGDWVVTGLDAATIERTGDDLTLSMPTVTAEIRISPR